MKVIGVGLNKTGTSTLKTCMYQWGFKHISYDLDAFKAYRNKDWKYLWKITDVHDSFENWPWALMYEQMYEWYPDAKFLLTVRKDAETWFKSLSNHGKRMGPLVDYEQYIYGYAIPDDNQAAHLRFYQEHNAAVEAFFTDKPGQLMKLCWENGDGWPQLGRFLNLAPPATEFPHANKTLSFFEKLERKYRPILGKYRRRWFG